MGVHQGGSVPGVGADGGSAGGHCLPHVLRSHVYQPQHQVQHGALPPHGPGHPPFTCEGLLDPLTLLLPLSTLSTPHASPVKEEPLHCSPEHVCQSALGTEDAGH